MKISLDKEKNKKIIIKIGLICVILLAIYSIVFLINLSRCKNLKKPILMGEGKERYTWYFDR